MDALKILVVGAADKVGTISSELDRSGHLVVPAPDLVEATEALMIQRFDAVLLSELLAGAEVEEFAAAVKELDRRAAGSRTPVLVVVPEGHENRLPPGVESAIDGVVAESLDADALTLAIARLASAVSVNKGAAAAAALAPELPVLDAEELKAQVAFDNELLIELIDLYLTERAKQSVEMKESLAMGDYDRLSRVAHTIKGSLGSLHASAARATAQCLELAARDSDAAKCSDFLPVFEEQLDVLERHLADLRKSLK